MRILKEWKTELCLSAFLLFMAAVAAAVAPASSLKLSVHVVACLLLVFQDHHLLKTSFQVFDTDLRLNDNNMPPMLEP